MIKSIVRVYGWNIADCLNLFYDDADFLGIEYWYKDAIEYNNEIAAANGIVGG